MSRSISLLLATGLLLTLLPPMAEASGGPYIVQANGTVAFADVTSGAHVVRVSGTFHNSIPFPDRMADAAYMTSAGQAGTCTSSPNLGLFVNGVKPWTSPCDVVGHTYTTTVYCPYSRCAIRLQIVDQFEGGLSDNAGYLTVFVDLAQDDNDPDLGCMYGFPYWCVYTFHDNGCWGWDHLLLDVYAVDAHFEGYRDCQNGQRTDYEYLIVRAYPVLGNNYVLKAQHYDGTYGCETGAWVLGVGQRTCVHTGLYPSWGHLLP